MSIIGKIFVFEILSAAAINLFGNGVIANSLLTGTKGRPTANWALIGLGWTFALFVCVLVGYPIGAQANVSVTIGLVIKDLVTLHHLGPEFSNNVAYVFYHIIGACLGSILGQLIVDAVYWGNFRKTINEPAEILACHSSVPVHKKGASFISESVGTLILFLAVFAASGPLTDAVDKTTLGPAIGLLLKASSIGITVGALVMSLGGTTGPALNPNRDLMPRILHQILPIPNKGSSQWGYSWVPVVAPISGAIVGGLLMSGFSF